MKTPLIYTVGALLGGSNLAKPSPGEETVWVWLWRIFIFGALGYF